jgi:hypothetical protein
MERPTYELKSKNEVFILFKFLKLVAIFVGAWTGIWFVLVFFIGRRRRTPVSPELFNLFSNVALYGAVGFVLFYIFSKIRNKQVEKVVFYYDVRVIKITYKSYFLHIKSVVRLSFDWIDSTIVSKQSFLYGDHHILSIFYKKKRVAYIGGASSDWQKLPNFLTKIDQRIRDIRSERTITKANQNKGQ